MIAIFRSIAGFILTGKTALFGFFTWITTNFVAIFVAIQVIVWIGSAIFTILLAFFGTEIIGSILDITGIKSYMNSILNDLFQFGNHFGFLNGNAFGSTVNDAINYFNIYQFLNFIMSVVFGIFALKINILLYRLTKFNNAKSIVGTGLTSFLGGYRGPGQ